MGTAEEVSGHAEVFPTTHQRILSRLLCVRGAQWRPDRDGGLSIIRQVKEHTSQLVSTSLHISPLG